MGELERGPHVLVTIAAEEKIQEDWRARRLASPARGKGRVGGHHRDRSIFSPCWIAWEVGGSGLKFMFLLWELKDGTFDEIKLIWPQTTVKYHRDAFLPHIIVPRLTSFF